jgi:hypothetical protein
LDTLTQADFEVETSFLGTLIKHLPL